MRAFRHLTITASAALALAGCEEAEPVADAPSGEDGSRVVATLPPGLASQTPGQVAPGLAPAPTTGPAQPLPGTGAGSTKPLGLPPIPGIKADPASPLGKREWGKPIMPGIVPRPATPPGISAPPPAPAAPIRREPTQPEMLNAMRANLSALSGVDIYNTRITSLTKGSCQPQGAGRYHCEYKPEFQFDCNPQAFDCQLMNAFPTGWNVGVFTRTAGRWYFNGML